MSNRKKASVSVPKDRPFVFINMAMTADGKIATENRKVSSFSSRRDQKHLLELRSQADAVMAGARTVGAGAVTLGSGGPKYRRMRAKAGLAPYNLRVIVSGRASISPDAEIFRHKFSPIVVLTTEAAEASKVDRLRAVADDVMVCGKDEIDFAEALRSLRKKWKVKRLLCEGGGQVNDALFRAGLADELHLTVCPRIFGGRRAPTIADGVGAPTLAEATRLRLKSARRVGDEMFFVFVVLKRDKKRGV